MLNILASACGCPGTATDPAECIVVIDSMVPAFVSTVVTIIKIVIPIILIVLGLVDLGKATLAQKDDEIKKAQMTFVKRIIAAVLVFFVVAIVQLVFGLLSNAQQKSDSNAVNPTQCIDCFINGNCATVEGGVLSNPAQ